MRSEEEVALDPFYTVAQFAILPPLRLWFTWRFRGWEHLKADGPMLVACNHLGYIDSLAAANMFAYMGRHPRFLGKAEMFEQPVLGQCMRALKHIPVYRGTGSHAPLDAAVEALGRGEVVVVYPEGTVTKREDHLPQRAKVGAAWLALKSGVPVTPLATWGTQRIWQKTGIDSLKFGRPITFEAGPAMDFSADADNIGDIPTLRRVTEEIMGTLTQMTEGLRDDYPEGWE